jgi:hypothetical protein
MQTIVIMGRNQNLTMLRVLGGVFARHPDLRVLSKAGL